MDDLKVFLIITGIVLVILIAVFTYLKNNSKMKGEISGFERHNESIDDVLLSSQQSQAFSGKTTLATDELPDSFTTKDSHTVEDLPPAVDSDWVENTRVVRVTQSTSKPKQKISIVHHPLPEGITDMVIAMSIQCDNHLFSGDEILAACAANNMILGEMNVFHYPADNNASTYALFSMANMVEPGTFDIDNMDSFTTPGVSLFMQIPMKMNCIEAYNIFVERAKLLAKSLHAELYDEKFNLLSPQIISHTIEKINSFQHELHKAKKIEEIKG
ncbi:MAG: cell division protein ZipA C-terminal FtsZ-binding domain-containing protein [Pseudomonadota bacterium]